MKFRRSTALTGNASTSWTRFRSSAQSIRVDGSEGRQARRTWERREPRNRGWVTASASEDGKVDGFTILDRVAVVAAVLSGEQLPFFVSLMATRHRNGTTLSPRKECGGEHTVEPDQGWARRRDQRCQRARNCMATLRGASRYPMVCGLRTRCGRRLHAEPLKVSGGLAQ